ncbi:hypothetical protein GH714_010730 [Hevea brasiliensis]|uniref:Uncharacterized protein n=1 Tax=Hevea brasiliensis TaxID=3981 RepID=A0A6A6LRL7_HEVBR|nr:hypothetical protein GH714_010730 [Hevea brasiliensis]
MIIKFQASSSSLSILIKITCPLVLLFPVIVSCACTCDFFEEAQQEGQALKYKFGSIASILVAGAFVVSLPFLANKIPTLRPENDIFFMIKAFAAGVILATGLIHFLPEAFDDLTSPCLEQNPCRNFPFTGFVAMMSTIGTLMMDSFPTGFYKRLYFNKNKQANVDEEKAEEDEHSGRLHVHTYAIHVMPMNSKIWDALLVALSFHQFFEGMGLGGCIYEAKFKSRCTAIMATFLSLTTPLGIGVGIGISSVYKENSTTSLIVEGIFNSASAGILIYMALVDLLAADFMNPRMQNSLGFN